MIKEKAAVFKFYPKHFQVFYKDGVYTSVFAV